MSAVIPVEVIESRILLIREHKVMIDADLAELYRVTTKRLNEQVKRNKNRFPGDFMFRLTKKEKEEVVAKCDHLARLKFSPALPFAFTEHGAIMLATVLNSATAVDASIQVVRAFVKLREMISTHRELARQFAQLERKIKGHGEDIKVIFQAIHQLMTPPEKPRRRIGFRREKDE